MEDFKAICRITTKNDDILIFETTDPDFAIKISSEIAKSEVCASCVFPEDKYFLLDVSQKDLFGGKSLGFVLYNLIDSFEFFTGKDEWKNYPIFAQKYNGEREDNIYDIYFNKIYVLTINSNVSNSNDKKIMQMLESLATIKIKQVKVKKITKQQSIGQNEKTNQQEETNMSKSIKTIASSQLEINKTAAINVAKITAGKALNTKLIKLIKPKLPMVLRGYADHPLFGSVLVNAIAMVIKKYSENEKAAIAADAMVESAMFQLADSFNIQETIDSFLDGFNLPTEEQKTKKDKKG